MTQEELKSVAVRFFGEHLWIQQLADALGLHRTTVMRWYTGSTRIRKQHEIAVRRVCRAGAGDLLLPAPREGDPWLREVSKVIRQMKADDD